MSDQFTPLFALMTGCLGFFFFSIATWEHDFLGIVIGLALLLFAFWINGQDYFWWPNQAEDRIAAMKRWEEEEEEK